MEEALQKAHDELEIRVRERTAELEKANERLEESERRFREVLENSLNVAYRRNLREDAYDYMSPVISSVLGYTPAEMFAMSFEQVLASIHPEDRERIGRELREAEGEPKEKYLLEYRFRRKDGEYRWIVDLIALVKDPEGRPLYRVGSIRDITEKKIAEESLKEYASKLENLNRDLEDFTFIAAHDLQEPLRKIQVFSDRILGEYASSLDETGRDYFKRMASSANRLQELIRDIRAYSKVTGNPSPFKNLNVEKVVREAISNLEFQIHETGATIQIGDLPSLEADPHLMYLLFQNLLSNALKYRNANHPVIKVSSRREDGDLQILVEDNGIGFDEKYLDQIFRPFKRLHARVEYEGTGIGLAICKKIVERHGGTITGRSTPGKGSTFIIDLPVKQASKRQ